jgi:peptidoglycan/LPS O-acetylase OafA/YrhL
MILTVSLLLSTCYEISCSLQNLKKKEILCIFSIYSNSKAIMAMKSFSPKEMIFLHGIRALAIIWIVIGHTHILYWLMPVINNNDFFQWITKYSTMTIYGGYNGVDTFFFLSAMLLSLSIFHELDKK